MSMENSSDVGSPMAGATDPASYRRMSDLGTHKAGNAPAGMQRLDGNNQPAQQLGEVRQFKAQDFKPNTQQQTTDAQQAPDLSKMVNLDALDANGEATSDEAQEMQNLEELQEDAEQQQGEVVDYEAKYKEWMESPDLPEEFQDRVMWFDADGKGDMQPIRIRDIPNNIMMYRDYQRKTAELGERNRKIDRLINGHKLLSSDVASGDASRGLRAFRYMGGEKTLEAMVMQYVNDRAELESLPQHVQQRLLAERQAADENHYLKQQMQMLQQEREREAQQQAEQQGVEAPDIQFVHKHIVETLPTIYQSLGIKPEEFESDAFQYELERVFENAARGTRAADGTYTVPPMLQRGRTPSNKLLTQLVINTKQGVDKMISRGYQQKPPKRQAPVNTRGGTGPSANPGQRGNMGAPQRMRWSDMGKR